MVKVYIYLRCSTESQSTDTHDAEIKDYCIKNELKYNDKNVYRDQSVSGNKGWKDRQIGIIIEKCKNGDHIVVSELSRLSRKAQDLHNIVALCNDKGIKIHCIKDGFRNDGTMSSVVMLGMLSTMSQLERELAVARSRSAIETMRRKGIKMGAPLTSTLDDNKDSIALDFKDGKMSINEIATKYQTTHTKLYSYAVRRNMITKNDYTKVKLKIPDKSPTGRKCKGSKFDLYIDKINKDIQDPNNNLKIVSEKYGFNYHSFRQWFISRIVD